MKEKYERFNEVTFQAYCIQSINRAIARGIQQKAQKAQIEVSLSEMLEKNDQAMAEPQSKYETSVIPSDYFEVGNAKIPIIDPKLAAALRSLTPERRITVLLSYLLNESDAEISKDLDIPKATVQDRRTKGIKKLRELLEAVP